MPEALAERLALELAARDLAAVAQIGGEGVHERGIGRAPDDDRRDSKSSRKLRLSRFAVPMIATTSSHTSVFAWMKRASYSKMRTTAASNSEK